MPHHPIPDDALDQDIAILGRKGGGKTYTSKGIVERLLDMGRRVLVLDPLGVWAGLRTSADGERPGYKIAIFGGLHADLPLDVAAAEPMARIIATENLPAVIDLSELSKTAQQHFLLKFLHELRRVNQEALTIVLEEADVFAPQQPLGDDSKALHAEIDWISRRGRFKGFRLISICQRPARLSKDVLTQANMLIMHRLPSPQDQGAGLDWIASNGDQGRAKEVRDTLGTLKVGEAWVLAQDPPMLERAMFPKIKTLDTSATPKAGERRIEPKTLAEVDVSAIRQALEVATPEPKAPSKSAKGPSADLIAAAELRGYERGKVDGYDTGYADARRAMGQRVLDFAAEFSLVAAAPEPRTEARAVPATSLAAAPPKALARAPMAPRAASSERPKGNGSAAGAKLLSALVRHPGGWSSWEEVAVVAGMIAGNGYFYGGKKYLLDTGLAVDGIGIIRATSAGIESAGGEAPPLSLAEIVSMWSAKLKQPAPMMLTYLAGVGSSTMQDMAAAINVKPGNGYWYRGVKLLRSAGLTVDDKSGIALAPLLSAAPR